jgi:hypothetical protein
MPNNKIPEENVDESIIFIAASDETFLLRSKFAMAAMGIVDSSSARKNISKLPLEIKRNKPNKADNINMKNSGRCSLFLSQPATKQGNKIDTQAQNVFLKSDKRSGREHIAE